VIWVVRRPVATWMIAIALLVFGWVSYQRLPLNLMPDLSYPTITVRTAADGYAPEEVESQVSQRIEESVATTPGLSKLESRSKANGSDVILSFQWGTEMDQAIQNVREQLQVTQLPDDVERPLILRYDPTLDPIIRIALSKPIEGSKEGTLADLRQIAERLIKKDLEAMDGVAAVRIRGGFEAETQVLVREDWMMARQVTIDQVIQTLQAENVNIPGGSILEGRREYLVRTLNAFQTVDDIRNIKIRRTDGVEIRLDEVAEIKEGYKERQVLSRLDGQEAVELEIYKAADANIVSIANQIKARIGDPEEIAKKKAIAEQSPSSSNGRGKRSGNRGRKGRGRGGPDSGDVSSKTILETLPSEVSLTVLEDQAVFIESAINNLRSTAVLGAFLAVVILFLFLKNFRATAIIGAAIPMSIVVTFIPMYIYDVSLNLMSLGGLALGIGMLVDNAVVALENIQVHLDNGSSRKDAASEGIKEVVTAIVSSTLTTISVFLPITFVEGIAGQIFGDLSLAVVFSLLASLGVAIYFVPMLAASEFTIESTQSIASFRERWTSVQSFKEDFSKLTGWHKWLWLLWGIPRFALHLLLNIIAVVMLYPILGTLWVVFKLQGFVVPPIQKVLLWFAEIFGGFYAVLDRAYQRWLPSILLRPSTVIATVALAVIGSGWVGSRLGATLLPEMKQGRFSVDIDLPIGTPLMETAQKSLQIEQQIERIDGIEHVYAIVGADSRVSARSGAGEHSIRYLISTTENEEVVMTDTRNSIDEMAQSTWKVGVSRPAIFSFDNPLELILYGKDLNTLRRTSDNLRDNMTQLDAIKDVQNSMRAGYPEIQIQYDRELLRQYNLSTSNAAQMVKSKVQGQKASTLSFGDERIDLTVRLIERDRQNIEKLKNININPTITPAIPLSSVATFVETEGPSEIRRIDQQRAAVISANIDGFDLSGATDDVQALLSDLEDSIQWEFAGQSKEMGESLQSMQFALALAIFLVYVIMASAFESILHPFVILFSVPLAIVGVIAGLWLLELPISVISLIGTIVLSGVVVNNAIVLVDTINRKRAQGLDKDTAISEAAKLRLRPIAITTLTTVLGLLPLALGYGEGAEIQQPLAWTIIAGLLSSTLLTLIVIPIVYKLLTQMFERPNIINVEDAQ
jgi:hydrophobic/amphiphilic exporter-1 (mainly G- bacteria), HAE1 family